jgi:hypothetical protein
MYVPISGTITDELMELIDLWDGLDDAARDDLLRVAREMANGAGADR